MSEDIFIYQSVLNRYNLLDFEDFIYTSENIELFNIIIKTNKDIKTIEEKVSKIDKAIVNNKNLFKDGMKCWNLNDSLNKFKLKKKTMEIYNLNKKLLKYKDEINQYKTNIDENNHIIINCIGIIKDNCSIIKDNCSIKNTVNYYNFVDKEDEEEEEEVEEDNSWENNIING